MYTAKRQLTRGAFIILTLSLLGLSFLIGSLPAEAGGGATGGGGGGTRNGTVARTTDRGLANSISRSLNTGGNLSDTQRSSVTSNRDGSVNVNVGNRQGGGGNNNNGATAPTCTQAPNLLIEDIYFVAPGGSVAVNQDQLVVGTTYEPMVTVANINCLTTAANGYHLNQAPFGAGGRFPVRLRLDYGAKGSFDVTQYLNNVGPVAAAVPVRTGGREPRYTGAITPTKIQLRFPVFTVPYAGIHAIESTVDVTNTEAPGQACTGAWGCINEQGTPESNTRLESFTTTGPRVSIGSYLVTAPKTVVIASTGNSVTQYNTLDPRLTSRDLATDPQWNRYVGADQYNNVGLYWTGLMINPASCTGTAVKNDGTTLSDFNGQTDIPGNNPVVSGFPGAGHNLDTNITEPTTATAHTYTVTCQTTIGTTVSDSITISNGFGTTSNTLPNITVDQVSVAKTLNGTVSEISTVVRLQNTGDIIPAGTAFNTEYRLEGTATNDSDRTLNQPHTLTADWNTNQVITLPLRNMGTVGADDYKVCINANNTQTIEESSYADNTRCANESIDQPLPTMTLESLSGGVVRYNNTASIRYRIEAPYIMQCSLTGSGMPTASFTHNPGVTENTRISLPLKSKNIFTLTCTPDASANASFGAQTRTSAVEVIPQLQEV